VSDLYVVFTVAGADYIVPSADVIQLESFEGATPVPGTAAFVAGVVQVRGNVVPAVDLRARFGLPATERTLDTRVVIVKSGDRHVALIADRAREVVRIENDRVKPPPPIVAEQAAGFVRAVAQAGPRLFMVLDFEKVIGEESHAR
jgi:purine-binding chemotaxis protein CheW